MSFSMTADDVDASVQLQQQKQRRQQQSQVVMIDEDMDEVVVDVIPRTAAATTPTAIASAAQEQHQQRRTLVFRDDIPNDEDGVIVLAPPIIRSNSITSASTFETAMFVDAQSHEEDILKAELKNLEEELKEQADRLLLVESKGRELRDQLLQVQHERDEIKEMHDTCQGEVESLRKQCESVIGLDLSLKAAITEIDRLRRLHSAAEKQTEGKDFEEYRFKVQALNLEVIQLNNSLETERLEKDRIRIQMENELKNMMDKLNEEMRAVFEQQISDANQEIERLRQCNEIHGAALKRERIDEETAVKLRTELLELQFEFSQVQESLEGTRAENDRIRKEASETIAHLTDELTQLVDERNILSMDLSTSIDEGNRLRFSIKEDGKVPREEVSKAVAHAVESRDQQIKELRQQLNQATSDAKNARDERNWLSARLKVSKEEAGLLQRQIVEQRVDIDHELKDAQVATNNALVECDRLREKLDVVFRENQEVTTELGKLRQTEALGRTMLSDLQQRSNDAANELLTCNSEREFLRKQLDDVRRELRELKQDSVSGLVDPDLFICPNDSKLMSELVPTTDDMWYDANGGITPEAQQQEESHDLDRKDLSCLDTNIKDANGRPGNRAPEDDVVGVIEESEMVHEGELHGGHEEKSKSIHNYSSDAEESKSVETQKGSESAFIRTLDSFEEHVHVWPRSWHDNDTKSDYGGRDLMGYGPKPPKPLWPNMAKVALNLAIHFGETDTMDATSDSSMDAYGSRSGFWRLHRLFTSKHFPCTVFATGIALEQNLDACHAMKEAGWEIASRGYRPMDYRNVDEETQTEHIKQTIAIHKKLVGVAPTGIHIGTPSSKTRNIVSRSFYYDSDSYSDELPFWTLQEGQPHLVIPHTLTLNDIRFDRANGFSTGEEFNEFLIENLEKLLSEGREGSPKMMSVGLHCRIVGRPGAAAGLSNFLDHVKGLGSEIWVCTREDIARFWYDRYYPVGEGKPVRASKI